MAGNLPEALDTLVFRLGVIGARIEARYAEALAAENLKPKHATLLGVLRMGAAGSQLELAALLQVAPSLVVALADQLVDLGAIARERDPADRRKQHLVLTPSGERLLDRCGELALRIDAELAAALGPDAAAVAAALERLGGRLGLPTR
jgi:DNA-binding MarR family transcriptional regulator